MSVDMRTLRGLSLDRAEMYGKPHINAWYAGAGAKSHRFDREAWCPLCGRQATNAHHCPPLGKSKAGSSFLLETPRGSWRLRPALMALDGSGTTGCHGLVHAGLIVPRWRWDDPGCAEDWWSGATLSELAPHDPALYLQGAWVFAMPDGGEIEVRPL